MFLVCCHYPGIHIARSLHTKWPLTFWAVDETKIHFDFWMIFDKVGQSTQPLHCVVVSGAYKNVPFLVAYCLLLACCCCYTAVQCTMHTQCRFLWFSVWSFKIKTGHDFPQTYIVYEESVLVLGTTQEWKLLQLTVGVCLKSTHPVAYIESLHWLPLTLMYFLHW
jgi:hypothetical protein